MNKDITTLIIAMKLVIQNYECSILYDSIIILVFSNIHPHLPPLPLLRFISKENPSLFDLLSVFGWDCGEFRSRAHESLYVFYKNAWYFEFSSGSLMGIISSTFFYLFLSFLYQGNQCFFNNPYCPTFEYQSSLHVDDQISRALPWPWPIELYGKGNISKTYPLWRNNIPMLL